MALGLGGRGGVGWGGGRAGADKKLKENNLTFNYNGPTGVGLASDLRMFIYYYYH